MFQIILSFPDTSSLPVLLCFYKNMSNYDSWMLILLPTIYSIQYLLYFLNFLYCLILFFSPLFYLLDALFSLWSLCFLLFYILHITYYPFSCFLLSALLLLLLIFTCVRHCSFSFINSTRSLFPLCNGLILGTMDK